MSLFDVAALPDTVAIVNTTDTTRRMVFSCANITTATTRTITIPNANGTMTFDGMASTMTGKTIVDAASNLIARELWYGSGSGSVSVYGSGAPTTGQVLTATSASTATWQNVVAIPATGVIDNAVQYNNGGVFGASASAAIDPADGCIVLNADYDQPAVVGTLKVKLFGAAKSSRLGWVGEDAFAYAVAGRAMWNMSPAWQYANGRGTTTVASLRLNNTVTGTATARAIATTNLLTSTLRVGYVSAASAGASAGWRHGSQNYWRGNGAYKGGFMFSVRFGMSSAATVANQRSFIGMYAGTGAFPNSNPGSTTGTAFVGFGSNSADTNWSVMHTSGGAVTTVSPGVSISAKSLSADLLEFGLYCRPNDTVVYWFMRDIDAEVYASGSITTNMPAANVLLSPIVQTNNGTTNAACAIDILSVYIESPF